LDIDDNFFWQGKVSGVKIGKKGYRVKEANFIFDTGTSLNYMPAKYFPDFIDKLLDGIYHFKYNGIYWGSCDTSLYPVAQFRVSGKWISVKPSTYVIDIGARRCWIGFIGQSGGEWLFGDVLFRGYYTVWDTQNDRIGFAPRLGTSTRPIYSGKRPFWSL
jgi:cathepsin D